jgi:hypothetical protein
MHVYAEIVSWIWAVFAVPICGYLLLFDWKLEEVQVTKTEFVNGVAQESTYTRPGR